jgi:hypothetical protein
MDTAEQAATPITEVPAAVAAPEVATASPVEVPAPAAEKLVTASPTEVRPSLGSLVETFSTITDPNKRREFYKANPELRAVYSEVNFH